LIDTGIKEAYCINHWDTNHWDANDLWQFHINKFKKFVL
jgi:hypothetical protein